MIKMTIDTAELKKEIGRIITRLEDKTPAMKVIGEIVKSSVIENFQVGGRPRWTPTKAISMAIAYRMKGKAIKTKRGGITKGFARHKAGKKTLIDTYHLQKSIAPRAFSDRAEIGTNVVYAAIHQFGGKAGRGKKVNIPARPFLMVQDEDWIQMKAAISKHIMGGKT